MSGEPDYGGPRGLLRRWRFAAVETVLAGTAVVALWLIARATGAERDG